MRAIISAIISACKTLFGIAAAMLSAPFRILFPGGGGRGHVEIPDVAPEVEIPPAPGPDYTKMYAELAVIVMRWCAESILAEAPMPIPPKFPRGVQEWVRGLTIDECHTIIEASERAVSAHLEGIFHIPSVRKMLPLSAAEWKEPAPACASGSPSRGLAATAAEL